MTKKVSQLHGAATNTKASTPSRVSAYLELAVITVGTPSSYECLLKATKLVTDSQAKEW